MKKILLALFSLIFIFHNISYGQDTTGMVAHWKMNGDGSDATGHGHTGNLHNVTSDTGKYGVPGTGYYFDGVNSFISIPYKADMNVSKFSICATLKIKGFYSGICQGNIVIVRGTPSRSGVSSGHFCLLFTDNAYDGDDCGHYDSTEDVMEMSAGDNYMSNDSFKLAPPLEEDRWYSVVATFDSVHYKIYINDTLVSSVTTLGHPMDSSTDSMIIGLDVWESPTFPYPFKGVMDDIRFYNRVLEAQEIHDYTTSTNDTTVTDTTNAVSNSFLKEKDITMYPNPTKNAVTIHIPNNIKGASLTLLNITGQTVLSIDHLDTYSTLHLATLPDGIYIARIHYRNETAYKKVLKE